MPRIVLITGANSGIGFQTAKLLASAPDDFSVILTGRDLAKVEAAREEITRATGKQSDSVVALQLDVTTQASIDKAVALVRETFGRLDVLINNAGIAPTGPNLEEMFRTTFDTNVIGPALVSAAFRSLLLASENPWHLYVGSETSSLSYITDPASPMYQTNAGSVAYRASKAALNMVAMHEQLETKEEKLNVRILCPGFVVSNLRGSSEEARTGWGGAGDPENSARLILSIIRGERDADADKLISVDGFHTW
ncbi:short chain dehydrogenase/reductase [Stachybotrys elegans]|uniref:Short chain dehydrogenase/reductase n=1 Tax=Stachybotrys elegans TaxID=80388 RepID=A0A8K0SJ70_9HYPO|nr:short chain dehydrogenase/reductase [Stachybotrys elegans]